MRASEFEVAVSEPNAKVDHRLGKEVGREMSLLLPTAKLSE